MKHGIKVHVVRNEELIAQTTDCIGSTVSGQGAYCCTLFVSFMMPNGITNYFSESMLVIANFSLEIWQTTVHCCLGPARACIVDIIRLVLYSARVAAD